MSEHNSLMSEAIEIRRNLLSVTQVQYYESRALELRVAMCNLELCGDAEKLSSQIAAFHLLKGKIETYTDILEDHNSAVAQLTASQTPQST